MRTSAITLLAAVGLLSAGEIGATRKPASVAATSPVTVKGDAAAGQKLYAVCMGCHSINDNDVGPKHRGVVGRRAGTVPGYNYSAALKGANLVWTPANLDRWLQGPPKMVPGTKMNFAIANAKQRADIIAYLATQK